MHPILESPLSDPGAVFGRGGEPYLLEGASTSKCNKEGEHSLILRSPAHGGVIAGVTFLVTRLPDDGWVLLVGGLQGSAKEGTPEAIKAITKSLHGLRPNALLVFALRQLAGAWRLGSIRAVGNQGHISQHADYRFNRSRRPRLAYDEFWRECGGEERGDGFFELPVRHRPRADASSPAHKRAACRRREAWLAGLGQALQARLAGLGPTAEPAPHPGCAPI